MNKAQAVRTRHPKAITRATILQKAYEMYIDRRLIHGDERLSLVLDELGYTTGAGYQIWANQAAFRSDLQVYVAENIEYASLRPLAHKIEESARLGRPFREHTLAGGDIFFDAFIGREDFYLSLRFFAMADDRPADISEALIDGYVRSSWETTALFESAFERLHRELRAPLQMSDLTTSVTALVEGYALRARLQPDLAVHRVEYEGEEHYLFSVAFLALVSEMTVEVDPAQPEAAG